jgi:hypothetical protein
MEISPVKTTTRKCRAKRQNSFKGGNNNRGMTRILPNLFTRPFISAATTSSKPQKRLVKSSIPILDDEIRVMTQDAPFIESTNPDESICLLDRSEVQVGKLLGQGQFSKVFSVTSIELISDADDTLHVATSTAAESPLSESMAKQEEQNKRQGFLEDFCQHRYAVKHLKKDLLKRKGKQTKTEMEQQFQLAAADLVVEALYLSRLSHPHILKVKAMANNGTQAFSNGRFDSYFLILDKLSETLDERIRTWRHLYRQPQEAHLCVKTYYALQMAQALAYLHERRILFRDLKVSKSYEKAIGIQST